MAAKKTTASVWIIYNPNSTGDSKKTAFSLSNRLKKYGVQAECVPTEYAGHAKKLAKTIAETKRKPIIFSSSGDGGYNEVINGVLSSTKPLTICGVLPAGNANDHYHAVHKVGLLSRITAMQSTAIDCIEVSYGNKKRYAHSYIGLGLTPQIGYELTEHALTRIVETRIVITKLFKISPVSVRHNGETFVYDHVLISNIPKMSKYLKVAPTAAVDDGMLELTTVKSGSFLNLLRHLFRRVVTEDAAPKQIREYTFTCMRQTMLQLDGEVITLAAGDEVTVRCAPKLLRSIT